MFMADITIVNGFITQLITGGHHPDYIYDHFVWPKSR